MLTKPPASDHPDGLRTKHRSTSGTRAAGPPQLLDEAVALVTDWLENPSSVTQSHNKAHCRNNGLISPGQPRVWWEPLFAVIRRHLREYSRGSSRPSRGPRAESAGARPSGDSSGGNTTNTSSSTSAQTEKRCPSSPQTHEKLLPTTWAKLFGPGLWDNPWKMEMKIPNAQIHSAALSNTDQNRSYHQSHKATRQITGVFRANYWPYALLSTASAPVWGKGHVIFWLHRHNILSELVYYIHDSHNKFSLFFCHFILSLGVIVHFGGTVASNPLTLTHSCVFYRVHTSQTCHKVSLNEAIARLWATAFKAH